MHSFIDEDPLPLQNEIENRYSNYREITQVGVQRPEKKYLKNVSSNSICFKEKYVES